MIGKLRKERNRRSARKEKYMRIILRNVIPGIDNYVLQRGAHSFGAQQHRGVVLGFKIVGGQDGLYPDLLQAVDDLVQLIRGV